MFLLAVATVIVVACACASDGAHPKTSTATSFATGTCAAIAEWGDHLVDAANAFTDDSPHLSAAGRRARYLFAFDEEVRITSDLRDELQTTPAAGVTDPDAIRAQLFHAIDDVTTNIRDQKADAAEHVNFHLIGPVPDRLFSGTEKSLSLMLKPLDEISRDRHVDELGGSCGRQPNQ
jgi:hypothetical protein